MDVRGPSHSAVVEALFGKATVAVARAALVLLEEVAGRLLCARLLSIAAAWLSFAMR